MNVFFAMVNPVFAAFSAAAVRSGEALNNNANNATRNLGWAGV